MSSSQRNTLGTALAHSSCVGRAIAVTCVAALGGCETNGNPEPIVAQTPDTRSPSVAHLWNEALLQGIRKDLARPTVHARNLFHVSAAMYDAWAVYSDSASTYLAGHDLNGFDCALDGVDIDVDLQPAREEAISYAAY